MAMVIAAHQANRRAPRHTSTTASTATATRNTHGCSTMSSIRSRSSSGGLRPDRVVQRVGHARDPAGAPVPSRCAPPAPAASPVRRSRRRPAPPAPTGAAAAGGASDAAAADRRRGGTPGNVARRRASSTTAFRDLGVSGLHNKPGNSKSRRASSAAQRPTRAPSRRSRRRRGRNTCPRVPTDHRCRPPAAATARRGPSPPPPPARPRARTPRPGRARTAAARPGRPRAAAGPVRRARTCARRRPDAGPERTRDCSPVAVRMRSEYSMRSPLSRRAANRSGSPPRERTCRAAPASICAPTCQPPVPAPCTSSRSPTRSPTCERAASTSSRSAIGDRQMLPMQTISTLKGLTGRMPVPSLGP